MLAFDASLLARQFFLELVAVLLELTAFKTLILKATDEHVLQREVFPPALHAV